MEEDDPSAFRWLTTNLDEKETSPGTRERRTILAELGRIKKPENLLFAAREICKKKPRTIDAIAWIRAHRRGREKPASEAELALAICRTIENYRATHGELTDEQLLDTLAALHRAVVKELAREH
jgi:hypothetical protein